MSHLTISFALMFFVVACSNIRAATAHHVGCNEADVRISDDNVGFDGRTWKAYCNNQTYDCESVDDDAGTHVRCVPVTLGETPTPDQPATASTPPLGTEPQPSPAAAPEGCRYDTQCKGDRICRDGECVDPVAPVPEPAPDAATDDADEHDDS